MPAAMKLLAHVRHRHHLVDRRRSSLSTISFGVPAGATTLCQMPRSKPGKVSAMVGISGASASRLLAGQRDDLDLLVAVERQRDVDALVAERDVAGQHAR